jgi:hypothetical protein
MSLKLKSFQKLNISFCYFDKNLLFVNDIAKDNESSLMSSYFKSCKSDFEIKYKQVEDPKAKQRTILAEKLEVEKVINEKNATVLGVNMWVQYLSALENDVYEQMG